MKEKTKKIDLVILLFVTFIDFMGMGLIYPIFSKLLFDTSLEFLPVATTSEVRGLWLGLLFALMPFIQFFSVSIWGTISDRKGRKRPLLHSLSFTILGHLISVFGVYFSSISILLSSRILLGIGSGNISIVQASIADFSSKETKAKNFGLYGMAIGAGFTLGPFIGGSLSIYGYSFPFLFSFVIASFNLILAILFYKETLFSFIEKKLSLAVGLINLKKAFHYKNIRTIFLCTFLVAFSWTYFMDFSPVYLIRRFNFSSAKIGLFYGLIGGFFALSSGLLIRPFLSRFRAETLFFVGALLTSLNILSILLYPSEIWLILFIVFFSFFAAFLNPTITTLVSNSASSDMQGEALGILGSINTAAYAISASIAGIFVGMNPSLSMWMGGIVMFISAIILLGVFREKLFKMP